MAQEPEAPRGSHVCGKCGASFETQEELDRHVASEHPDDRGGAGAKPGG